MVQFLGMKGDEDDADSTDMSVWGYFVCTAHSPVAQAERFPPQEDSLVPPCLRALHWMDLLWWILYHSGRQRNWGQWKGLGLGISLAKELARYRTVALLASA